MYTSGVIIGNPCGEVFRANAYSRRWCALYIFAHMRFLKGIMCYYAPKWKDAGKRRVSSKRRLAKALSVNCAVLPLNNSGHIPGKADQFY